jgi:hypothetical protein
VLTIDYSRGYATPAGGIVFDGGGGINGVVFTGPGVLDVGKDLTLTGPTDLTITGGAVTLPAGTILGALSISESGQVKSTTRPSACSRSAPSLSPTPADSISAPTR